MAHYSVQPRYQIFTKGYGFLSLAKSMDRNTGNNKNKKSSGKCSQKFIDHAKKSARDAFKTASKGPIQKMIMSSLCYYGDESIHFKVTITIPNHAIPAASNNPNKKKNEVLKIIPHLLIA